MRDPNFERGNLRGTLLEVADDFGIAFSGEKLESMHAGCLRDVIKRDLSFQTRRQTSRNSSGVLRKNADRMRTVDGEHFPRMAPTPLVQFFKSL